jgi:hypothetical protein
MQNKFEEQTIIFTINWSQASASDKKQLPRVVKLRLSVPMMHCAHYQLIVGVNESLLTL